MITAISSVVFLLFLPTSIHCKSGYKKMRQLCPLVQLREKSATEQTKVKEPSLQYVGVCPFSELGGDGGTCVAVQGKLG